MSRTHKDQRRYQEQVENTHKNNDKPSRKILSMVEREMLEDFYNSFWN